MEIPKHHNFKNITGQTIGYWKVLSLSHKRKDTYYWNAQCKCSKMSVRTAGQMRTYSSCMCQGKDTKDILTKQLYLSYKYASTRHNRIKREFSLTIEQFEKLIYSNCYYCDKEPSNTKKLGRNKFIKREIKYNGIDRIDNNIGYLSNNVVTCCWICNQSKADFNQKEFLNWIKMIYNKCIKNDESQKEN